MRTLLRRTTVLWTREEGPTLVLVFLLALLFVVPFLEEWFPVVAPASTGFFILLLVAGVRAVSRSLWAALVVSLLAGTAIAFEVVRQLGGGDSLAGWRTGAGCLTVGLFAAVTLFRVFAPGPITGHRLVGAVAVYLLAGLTWAFAYEWLSVMRPGS